MNTISNEIFRLVSLRGPDDRLSINPGDAREHSDVDGPVLESANRGDLDSASASRPMEFTRLQAEMESLTGSVQTDLLDSITEDIYALLGTVERSVDLSALETDTVHGTVSELVLSDGFRRGYANAYNLWLLGRVRGEHSREIHELERRIRVGYLLLRANRLDRFVLDRDQLAASLEASILLPASLKIVGTRAGRRTSALSGSKEGTTDEPERFQDSFAAAERIQAVVVDELLRRRLRDGPERPSTRTVEPSSKGLIPRLRRYLFGEDAKLAEFRPGSARPEILDEPFLANIRLRLSDTERSALDELIEESPDGGSADEFVEATNNSLRLLSIRGNRALAATNAGTLASDGELSPPIQSPLPAEDGAIQALGWGDLILAQETLVGYQAREIAHIENILPGEKKNRHHTRSSTVEEIDEIETTKTEESERDLQTTSRHELQTESANAINEELSIATGVNTSGRYGLTKVETSLDAGFSQSNSESRSSTTSVAKEIVSKAVERTFSSVRSLRKRTVTLATVEHNAHELLNQPAGASDSPPAISGIYRWVEKVHEIQLRHYGTRMMIEFSIPEPAVSIVGSDKPQEVSVDEPPPVDFDASFVTETNYLALASLYGATAISSPPEQFARIGFSWSSTPVESDDEDTSESVLSDYIPIPKNFRPMYGTFVGSALPIHVNDFVLRLQIGGQQFVRDHESSFSGPVLLALDGGGPWPRGVPVSMTAHGHYDKTLSLNVMITCKRTDSATADWRMKTYEAIVAAHQRRLDEYNDAVEMAALPAELGVLPTGQPDAINRRTEREEIQKWATKLLQRKAVDFDAIVLEGDDEEDQHNEIDPVLADFQAPFVRFYEEAFEWELMSYFFYPYFWGRRRDWRLRQSIRHSDSRFEAFLRAGACRAIVPVTPGYEARVLFYLANPGMSEDDLIAALSAAEQGDTIPDSVASSIYDSMWLEQMLNKNDDLAIGSGYLGVTEGEANVLLVESEWRLNDRDVGRELFIKGDRYVVQAVLGDGSTFSLSEPYLRENDPRAIYAAGSVPFGPSWVANLPTNLVILDEHREELTP
ncbi:MAG: hypothetical protein WD354_00245 [Acidimicrobiia bacterium]